MEKTAGRILKADKVKFQGQFHLDITQTPKSPAAVSQPASGKAQVAIIEKNADFAVLEVTCCCGTKTQLRCDYTNGRTS